METVAFQINQELDAKTIQSVEHADKIEISDTLTYIAATEFLLILKSIQKEIDETFNGPIEAAHASHKSILAAKKKHSEPITEAERIIKIKIGSYLAEQEKIRIAEERRLQEEARKRAEEEQLAEAVALEASGESVAAEELIQAPVQAAPVVLPKSTPKVSGISVKKMWKWRLMDATKVNREFLSVDETKVNS